jgi:hypothetical protein
MFTAFYAKITINKKITIIKKHFHHSFVGLLLAITGIFLITTYTTTGLFLLGFGTGGIINHSLTERFVFISKD